MPYSHPETAPALADLFSLKERTALVVGGAGLLGGEISHALAELGAHVVVASRDLEKCRAFAVGIARRHGTRADALRVDITDPESIRGLLDETGQLVPSLDVLVNCGWSGRKNTFDSITDADWDRDVEVCLNGVFRTVKAAVPLLTPRRGNILSVASMYGHVAPDYRMYDGERFANPPSYGAAKAGLLQLTRYLASFLSPQGIRVNAISPGPFPYESTQVESPDFIERLCAKNPLGRIGHPHELKGAAALLCTDAGAYITGQNLCVDGGWTVW
jgi:NAD(P)-dependent dehydrogenase (short-subunit alcohol dehydrogenase family)